MAIQRFFNLSKLEAFIFVIISIAFSVFMISGSPILGPVLDAISFVAAIITIYLFMRATEAAHLKRKIKPQEKIHQDDKEKTIEKAPEDQGREDAKSPVLEEKPERDKEPDPECLEEAKKYKEKGDRTTARALLLDAASRLNDPKYLYELGKLHLYAERAQDNDPNEAKKWFQKAADMNHPPSQRELGIMLYQGRGADPDYLAAAEQLRLAGDQEDHRAWLHLGYMYQFGGPGFSADENLAASYYLEASKSDDYSTREEAKNALEKLSL